MKIHVIDYKANGELVQILKITGVNSTADIKAAGEGVGQLAATGPSDLASASVPLLTAIANYSSGKTKVEPTPDAIWAHWNPAPKSVADRIAEEATAPKVKTPKEKSKIAKEKSNKKSAKSPKTDLTPGNPDGKKAKTGNSADGVKADKPKEGNMATKKKAAKKKTAPKAKKAKSGEPRGEKTGAIKKMLMRASGCTRAQMTEVTGWKTLSFQAIAKTLGLKLKKVKEPGKPTCYFGS